MPIEQSPSSHSSPGDARAPQRLGEQIERSVERAEDQALDRAHELRARLDERARSARARAADGVRRLGDAVRTTREQLTPEDDSLRQLFGYAGDELDRAARYLSNVDGPRLRRDAEEFSRRHPGVVVGGALLLGLAAGRLLKGASARTEPPPTRDPEHDWGSPRTLEGELIAEREPIPGNERSGGGWS
jgi:hypothetical protein